MTENSIRMGPSEIGGPNTYCHYGIFTNLDTNLDLTKTRSKFDIRSWFRRPLAARSKCKKTKSAHGFVFLMVFRTTVGPKRPWTVEAKHVYGRPKEAHTGLKQAKTSSNRECFPIPTHEPENSCCCCPVNQPSPTCPSTSRCQLPPVPSTPAPTLLPPPPLPSPFCPRPPAHLECDAFCPCLLPRCPSSPAPLPPCQP